ncbi:hypothetical protein E1B28_013507 [Marasmius oreades]|uniref:Uncharacterized protein n=1 Tax=Marasmius oreades TaxID=181124 RepID=A0A9P7RPQ9_9AGAR|nr:uncharacterized protein E1B28_013507 [Marasmius oreades]KAG7087551.1 hypothetical protein E1B28_013507 [Marasmius oreades]
MYCWMGFSLILAILLTSAVCAQDPGLDTDPYLQYKPPFVQSLPVQILVTGVVFTLVSVLFIHLLFTAQYHWPLAPVNYILQLAGVTTLLISLIATLNVVLQRSIDESDDWPYMISYISVNVPPSDEDWENKEWTLAERATWVIMMATTSVLVQITHIQFLGLLYPSTLEKRLIFSLLGPLAILSATMQLIPISASSHTIEIASAIRNVCNATLSLLFTAALFIWGLLVNRVQAWRTDGGTAVFGAAALALAIASTALNFLYVPREEEYVWLPGLMWAVTLWQSFLGWWWWVGAGSGATTEEVVEEVLRRGQRISGKREQRRRARRMANGEADVTGNDATNSTKRWRMFERRSSHPDEEHEHDGNDSSKSRRRRRARPEGEPRASDNEGGSAKDGGHPTSNRPRRSNSVSSTTSVTTSSTGTLPGFLPRVIHEWYANLRHAHVTAARIQAEERRERIMELERAERERVRVERERVMQRMERAENDGNRRKKKNVKSSGGVGWFRMGVPGTGWGLGYFGWRLRQEGASATTTEAAYEMDKYENGSRRGRERTRERDSATSGSDDNYTDEDDQADPSRRNRRAQSEPQNTNTEGRSVHCSAASIQPPIPPQPPEPVQRQSLWWWGPLGKWRLQDSTMY